MKKYLEPNKKLRIAELAVLVCLLAAAAVCYLRGNAVLRSDPGLFSYAGTVEMELQSDLDEYDEDSTVCEVVYGADGKEMVLSLPYEVYSSLDDTPVTAYEYRNDEGTSLFFDHMNPSGQEISSSYRTLEANELMPAFNLANALIILALSMAIVMFWGVFFTTYEKCWFLSIMVLATIFAVLFPEESANGVNGIIIMLLYLLDTFLNILCELLISKQSRFNFLVSVAVEITEIAICLVLMYRFATMAVTLFFWLPIDIISFINWTKHKDEEEEELTVVRRLKGYQEILVIAGIAVWTVVVGYLLSGLHISTDFFGGNRNLEVLIIYIDACASAVGIANGLFIFFRLREQWIAWYICAALEALINILTGQYVLLVLKLGYFTNTTYGYLKWTKYIREHTEAPATLF